MVSMKERGILSEEVAVSLQDIKSFFVLSAGFAGVGIIVMIIEIVYCK